MANRDGSGVGLVKAKFKIRPRQVLYRSCDLLLAGAAHSDDGLFDAEGGVFEDRQPAHGGGSDGGTAGGAQDLGGLEVLHVNCLLHGDVIHRMLVEEVIDLITDGTEAFRHGKLWFKAKRSRFQDADAAIVSVVEHGKPASAQAGVDPKDATAKGSAQINARCLPTSGFHAAPCDMLCP